MHKSMHELPEVTLSAQVFCILWFWTGEVLLYEGSPGAHSLS